MLSSGCDVNVRDVWLWGYSEEGASCSANRFVRVELELAITVDRGQSIFADSGEEGVLEPCFSGFGEAGSEFFLKLPPSTEDTTSIHADLTIHIHNVASVGHHPPASAYSRSYCGYPMAPRQEGQLDTPSVEEGVVANE